jgi:DNA-binding GntR family transcriptional regulator
LAVSSQTSTLDCDHGNRRSVIVASILSDVFLGRLRAGQHLVTQELADRFGVSHTPIREALIALGGTGIIELLPNRGAIVRQVSGQDVREVCQVRRILECEAVRSACGRIDAGELGAVADGLRRQMGVLPPFRPQFIEDARALDSRLHDLVAGSCGNAFLAHELSRLKILFRAFRDVAWEHDEARNDYHRVVEESREHLDIVQSLLGGDARGASRAMSKHILAGARYWSRALWDAQPEPRATSSPTRRSQGEPSR